MVEPSAGIDRSTAAWESRTEGCMRRTRRYRTTTLSALSLVFAVPACELVLGLDGERVQLEADGEGGSATASGSSSGAGNNGSGARAGRGGSSGSAGASGAADDGGHAGAGARGAGTGGTAMGDAGHAGSDGGEPGNTAGMGGQPVAGGAGGVPSDGGRPAEVGTELTTPSCAARDALECPDVNPCLSIDLPGGTFRMGRSADGADRFDAGSAQELPEHDVTLDAYRLDKHEVSVGRFRTFVESYDGTPPASNAGQHPSVLGSGWQPDWNQLLPSSQSELLVLLGAPDENWGIFRSWTDEPGENECMPMNFIDWYLAFAFCIWDGGRLPSEAEWEYAAAGAEENRIYPWGDEPPADRYAVFRCGATGTAACEPGDLEAIGSRRPRGDGRFGHSDLGGSLEEFVRDGYRHDFYALPQASYRNPINLGFDVGGSLYVVRGGSYIAEGPLLRATSRGSTERRQRAAWLGVRCARQP